ncbi:MAG: hypothetical protein E7Z87_04800 [Cyanobacteria bacterium SIG26]|nr:hypothetical protein [Cyanobacteria bacterium SIG26]
MQIRGLTYFDYRKLKRLVSYLCNEDNDRIAKSLMQVPVSFLNAVLPLALKFHSESFILVENAEILGLITLVTTPGNPYKINITRLIFKDNCYEVGKQLVEFVIQKYGAKGATSFMVTIDECHDELFNLFINGCGFRKCASETLWKIEKPTPQKVDIKWRYAQVSDTKSIAELYNSELINMYKPSLTRHPKEFQDSLLGGLAEYYKTRYLLEDNKKIMGYLSITTSDNLNYIIDMTLNSGYEYDYEKIINLLLCEIAGKRRAFYPLIKQKKYVKNSDHLGEYLQNKGYLPIQTQQILVKDYYKPLPAESQTWKVFTLGENQVSVQ